MRIWIDHWHCIVPAAAIAAALLVLKFRESASAKKRQRKDGMEESGYDGKE